MAELLVLVLVVLVGAITLILLSLEKKYIVMSNSNVLLVSKELFSGFALQYVTVLKLYHDLVSFRYYLAIYPDLLYL